MVYLTQVTQILGVTQIPRPYPGNYPGRTRTPGRFETDIPKSWPLPVAGKYHPSVLGCHKTQTLNSEHKRRVQFCFQMLVRTYTYIAYMYMYARRLRFCIRATQKLKLKRSSGREGRTKSNCKKDENGPQMTSRTIPTVYLPPYPRVGYILLVPVPRAGYGECYPSYPDFGVEYGIPYPSCPGSG